MNLEYLISGVFGIVILYFIVKIIKLPLKLIIKLLINGLTGLIMLSIVNFIGDSFGITVNINAFTSLIAGFLGIPGVIALVIFNLL
ncbi:pro-sigmaK processing inhibitor BofA family protein [Clostridium sp. HCP1S3_B4]|uniref:pro-sigmaK processing inhibitor BofA family protein n=1 Tax=unclassified Clostridium TaxID=2614128 RepID=UPI0016ACE5B3|nr:pro-sigmaK processing inhibitor BofA family protein [Clostridiales bacterium]MDY2729127.1 pro-sigmaK processing inhibitor BofA family protein [Clostridium sp.]NLK22558.1 pro-sigmaK processing inhibitor BofA [Clostridiales bacterium]